MRSVRSLKTKGIQPFPSIVRRENFLETSKIMGENGKQKERIPA
jgi:hypothetical protein